MPSCHNPVAAQPNLSEEDRQQDRKVYALIGNPNCGTTTLFNELTGTTQHVSNLPGVTVEEKVGTLRKEFGEGEIVDLPGIYSLDRDESDEKASRAFIVKAKPDVVINVVEAGNLERNLFLTCQIAELGVPMVVAVNMMDEARAAGTAIDCKALSKELGLPVVPITAITGEGVIELMDTVGKRQLMELVERESESPFHDGLDEHGHGFHDIEDPEEHRRDHHTDELGRTNALLAEYKYHNHYKGPMTFHPEAGQTLSDEQVSSNAKRRYDFIKQVVGASVTHGSQADDMTLSDKIDRVVTSKYLGLPLFLLAMFIMFHCTFSEDFLGLSLFGLQPIPSPGVWLQGIAQNLVDMVTNALGSLFQEGTWLRGLVVGGICGGVGAVLSFLPQICVLFFFLTLFEDIGYMARAAFIMDRAMRPFGLSGKSFVPMLMGFGCNVPAMMACRTMENEADRKITLFLVPFMNCGGRAPIFLVFAAAFFPNNGDLIVFGMYLLGIVVAVFTGWMLKTFIFKGETTMLVLELPRYRAPHVRMLWLALSSTVKDYLKNAGTIIFFMSIVVWFASNFGFANGGIEMVPIQDSFLATLAGYVAVVLVPLGFGSWYAAVALITGLATKEAVIGTLGVFAGTTSQLGGGLTAATLGALGFTAANSFSFLVFTLLYVPCIATVAALRHESKSRMWMVAQVCYSLSIAWVLSFIAYHAALALGV